MGLLTRLIVPRLRRYLPLRKKTKQCKIMRTYLLMTKMMMMWFCQYGNSKSQAVA